VTKKVWAKLISLIALIVLVVILITQNTKAYALNIFFWDLRISLALLLLLVFLLGFVTGLVTVLHISARQRQKGKK
jgi:uncharacterized integral membrane protein